MSFRDLTPQNIDGKNSRTPPRRQRSQSPLIRSSSTSNKYSNTNYNRSSTEPLNSAQQYKPFDKPIEYNRSQSDPYADGNGAQSLLVQQREEQYAQQVMQQREDELRDIHKKMHVVNEIYKDLGEVVDEQQDDIDRVENKFGEAAMATQRGLEQLEKANSRTNRKKKGGAKGDDTGQNDEEGGTGKKKQFFLFHYLSKTASEVAKLVSVCGGKGNNSYVPEECWNDNNNER